MTQTRTSLHARRMTPGDWVVGHKAAYFPASNSPYVAGKIVEIRGKNKVVWEIKEALALILDTKQRHTFSYRRSTGQWVEVGEPSAQAPGYLFLVSTRRSERRR